MSYVVGQQITGIVINVKSYGLFIKFGNKFGFCHISNCSHGFIKDLNELFPINKEITAKILEIDDESGRINVSIKDCELKEESQIKMNANNICNSTIQSTNKEEKLSFEDMMKNYLKSSNEKLNCIGKRNQKHRK